MQVSITIFFQYTLCSTSSHTVHTLQTGFKRSLKNLILLLPLCYKIMSPLTTRYNSQASEAQA